MDILNNSTFLAAAALIMVILLYLWYNYAYAPYQYLKRIGIPGPSPLPFIGNLHQSKEYMNDLTSQLCSKYGETCGFYIGRTPFVVTTNLDMIKEYTIKKFDYFENRSNSAGALVFEIGGKSVPSLVTMKGDEWRSARHGMTPALSSHKMKQMEPMIRDSAHSLLEKFGEVAGTGKTLNMTDLYQKLLIEILLAAAFGREIHVQDGRANRLHEEATGLMAAVTRTPGGQYDGLFALGAVMPWVTSLLQWVGSYTQIGKSKNYMVDVTEKIIDYRRKEETNTKKDILQVMLDSANAKKMKDSHVIALGIDVLLAGHETTTSSLSFSSFLLATNPEVQEKLISEIADYFAENPDKTYYEAAQEIEYLDMFLMETFRKYSPGSMLVRRCNKSCEIGGYPIKEGTYMVTPIYGVHYNKEYWPEPEKFDPERFSKENKSKIPANAHMPFGAGPRQCIGMRLAILNAKIVLIEILKKYKFALSPDTKVPMRIHLSIPGSPKDILYLRVEPLNP